VVGKAFLKFSSFSKCVQIAFLRLVLLRLRIIRHREATGIGQGPSWIGEFAALRL
jgi:hypothetical protein